MPDKKTVSQKELADMANVSTATISRVLNNNGRFSEATRLLQYISVPDGQANTGCHRLGGKAA